MRAFCVMVALTICGMFLYSWTGSWARAVQAYHDLNGVIVGVMLLAVLAAPLVALAARFDGVSERGAVSNADDDGTCD